MSLDGGHGCDLWQASRVGSYGLVRDLLKSGAPVDSLNESRQTPLHLAVEADKVDVAELLILSGASVNSVSQPDVDTPLHLVASAAMAELLLESGASCAAKNAWLQTPLHCACKRGEVDVIKCFVSSGCDLNAKDQQGRTPLHYCASGNKVDAARCLLDASCNPEMVDCDGLTALQLAKLMAFHDVANVIGAHERAASVFSAEK